MSSALALAALHSSIPVSRRMTDCRVVAPFGEPGTACVIAAVAEKGNEVNRPLGIGKDGEVLGNVVFMVDLYFWRRAKMALTILNDTTRKKLFSTTGTPTDNWDTHHDNWDTHYLSFDRSHKRNTSLSEAPSRIPARLVCESTSLPRQIACGNHS